MKQKINSLPLLAFLAIATILFVAIRVTSTKKGNSINSLKLESLSREDINLSDYNGQYYIIHIFSSWCKICKEDLHFLKKIKQHKKLPIIGIAVSDQLNKLIILNKKGWPYDQIAFDGKLEAARTLRTRALPETILVNPEGEIILHLIGGLDSRKVEQKILPLIK